MAWDGSGSFTRTNGTHTGSTTWANSRDAGNNILASLHDVHDQDLADGINACLAKNGENGATGAIKPATDNATDLGSSAKRWRQIYLSGFVGDGSGNELLKFSATASAVNELTVTNAAAGNPPSLNATGGDTDISISLVPKGAGVIDISGATGGKIKFPATQNASADANTLDDYEEGSWTPAVGGTATYTVQAGTYTKIGNLVTIQLRLTINAIGTGSTAVVSGLPFTNGQAVARALSVGLFVSSATNYIWVGAAVNASAATLSLVATAAAVASATDPAVFFGNSASIVIGGHYYV